jgi:hypothetical protein
LNHTSELFSIAARFCRDYNGSYITEYGPQEPYPKKPVRIKWLEENRDVA